MKKSVTVIVLIVLVGILLIAATPAPPPLQHLVGILRWGQVSVCGGSDYVSLPIMRNVYLTGKFPASHGEFQGCQIDALGTYKHAAVCSSFEVYRYRLTCPTQTLMLPASVEP